MMNGIGSFCTDIFSVDAFHASRFERAGLAMGARMHADVLAQKFQQPMQFVEIIGVEIVRRRHHRIVDGERIGARLHQTEALQHTEDMGVGDEGALAQAPEVQRRRRDLAPDAVAHLEPSKRRVGRPIAQEFEIERAVIRSDAAQRRRKIQGPVLEMRDGRNVGRQILRRCIGEPVSIAMMARERDERIPRHLVVCPAAEERADELAYRIEPDLIALRPEQSQQAIADGIKLGRLAEIESGGSQRRVGHLRLGGFGIDIRTNTERVQAIPQIGPKANFLRRGRS